MLNCDYLQKRDKKFDQTVYVNYMIDENIYPAEVLKSLFDKVFAIYAISKVFWQNIQLLSFLYLCSPFKSR